MKGRNSTTFLLFTSALIALSVLLIWGPDGVASILDGFGIFETKSAMAPVVEQVVDQGQFQEEPDCPNDLFNFNKNAPDGSLLFTRDYETERRAVHREIFEQWQEFKDYLKRYGDGSPVLVELELVNRDHFIEILGLLELQRQEDGFDEQRKIMAKTLSSFVMARLHAMQNPEDCSQARILVCDDPLFHNENNDCGWPCMMLHLLNCFQAAFATNRMLVADPKLFQLTENFMSLTDTCKFEEIPETKDSWPDNPNSRIVKMSPASKTSLPPNHVITTLYPYIPRSVVEYADWVSPDPPNWFVGQFLAYLLRPNANFQGHFDQMMANRPQAAIHFSSIDDNNFRDHMDYIEEFFDIKIATGVDSIKKEVYISAEDPNILDAVNNAYAEFKVIGKKSEKTGYATLDTDLLRDFYKMVGSDFLVCKYTLHLCRLAYKLRTATTPLVTDLHEVVILDMESSDDQKRKFVALHNRTGFSDWDELDFVQGPVTKHTADLTKTNIGMERNLLVSDSFPLF